MPDNKELQWLLKEKYQGQETADFADDCKRLAAGEPLAYVIGFVEFCGCTIYLDKQPLIPRSETEYWTELAIAAIHKAATTQTQALRVLDLCAGSGAIGVAVAKAQTDALVSLAEIDSKLLTTIEGNLQANLAADQTDWADRVELLTSDLFSAVSCSFDFILSNPPYIDPELDRTQDSVKAYEPSLALYGGQGGLAIIERILARAANYLKPNGQLWIEHEPEQVAAISELASKYHWQVANQPDQYRTIRYSVFTQAVPK